MLLNYRGFLQLEQPDLMRQVVCIKSHKGSDSRHEQATPGKVHGGSSSSPSDPLRPESVLIQPSTRPFPAPCSQASIQAHEHSLLVSLLPWATRSPPADPSAAKPLPQPPKPAGGCHAATLQSQPPSLVPSPRPTPRAAPGVQRAGKADAPTQETRGRFISSYRNSSQLVP